MYKEEQISRTCLGRSSRVLKDLLGECPEEYLNQVKHKTTTFEHRDDRWKKKGAKNIRPLSTVILNKNEKRPLIDDIKGFLDPETRRWYPDRALPYRRGYLLCGPLGTGKSSLSLPVAGQFDLNIYVVSIPNTADQRLKDLFDKLLEKCVVLLEDIDVAGVARSPDPETENSDDEKEAPRWKTFVTLPGLLNTLDGVASQEGRIVVMTTTHLKISTTRSYDLAALTSRQSSDLLTFGRNADRHGQDENLYSSRPKLQDCFPPYRGSQAEQLKHQAPGSRHWRGHSRSRRRSRLYAKQHQQSLG